MSELVGIVRVTVGPTYKVRLPDDAPLYVTINDFEGKPFEVFLRCDRPEHFESMVQQATSISRQLQLGVPLRDIATDMVEIFGLNSGHHAGGQWHSGIVSRVGQVLLDHCNQMERSAA